MRIIRFLIILLITISLCGCADIGTSSEPQIVINMPTDNMVNGYRISSQAETDQSNPANMDTSSDTPSVTKSKPNTVDTYYCASISGSKFHIPTCGSAKNIKEENLITAPDRQKFIDDGYEPCRRCNP